VLIRGVGGSAPSRWLPASASVLVGFTAEYLSFGGLSQYIAMLFGLLAARMRYPVAAAMPSGVGARAPAPLVAS